jgi:hypothetical protein
LKKNIIGILKFFSAVHTRPAYSYGGLSIGIVFLVGIVPYQAVIYWDIHCIIVWYGNTGVWVPKSWNPVDCITILIGSYVRGSANILTVLARI